MCGGMVPVTAAEIPENLYELYTFNEVYEGAIRTVAADRSGKGHDARLVGSAKYVADNAKNSKVLYTDGKNQSYMEFPLPTGESGNLLEAFTVSMDMKNSTTGNYFNFCVGDGSTNISCANCYGYKMAGDILISAKNSSEEKKTTLTGKGVQGAWTHVDFVLDNGKCAMYVNGSIQ